MDSEYDYLLDHENENNYIKTDVPDKPSGIKEVLCGIETEQQQYKSPWSIFFGIVYDWHKDKLDRPVNEIKLGYGEFTCKANWTENFISYYISTYLYESKDEKEFKKRRRIVGCGIFWCIFLFLALIVFLILLAAGILFAKSSGTAPYIPDGPTTTW